jgi:hypothetical protein
MKKKLEAELISIAHRILKLKNKDDVRELHQETQKLYQKLSVLLFVEENFSDAKPTIGLHDINLKLESAFDLDEKTETVDASQNEEAISDNKIKPISIINDIMGEINADNKDEFVPIEDTKISEPLIAFEDNPIIEIPKADKKQASIDDLLESVQSEPVFERVDKQQKKKEAVVSEEISKIIDNKINHEEVIRGDNFIDVPETLDFIFEKVDSDTIATNLNDKLKKSINVGLNDRLAFEKNLFGGSSEDYNRVISQLSTFDNIDDAKTFINEMVKPDYDNWVGKEEFAERFMEIVENKFI